MQSCCGDPVLEPNGAVISSTAPIRVAGTEEQHMYCLLRFPALMGARALRVLCWKSLPVGFEGSDLSDPYSSSANSYYRLPVHKRDSDFPKALNPLRCRQNGSPGLRYCRCTTLPCSGVVGDETAGKIDSGASKGKARQPGSVTLKKRPEKRSYKQAPPHATQRPYQSLHTRNAGGEGGPSRTVAESKSAQP